MRLSVLLTAVGVLGSFTYLNVSAQCGCGANADVDADNDGYCSTDDCDDLDPQTYPGAAEKCDGKDNDCDMIVPTNESDLDRDGVAACAGDCDDTNAQTYPGATEACDGRDNNCDGAVPANENDGDGDGVSVCGGDCDDTDPAIKPGATETCNGKDDNCDGLVPSNEADSDGDGFRVCQSDCNDSAADTFPGAQETCDARDQNCDGLADVVAASSDRWLRSVCGAVLTGGASYDGIGVDQPSISYNSSLGIYQMWFRAVDSANVQTIGYAESANGVSWSKEAAPVLKPGSPEAWDGLYVGFPSVLLKDGVYHMWYQGQDSAKKLRIGYATSPDGKLWTRNTTNPVLNFNTSGWDSKAVQAPTVIWDSSAGLFKMWYTGSDGVSLRTGYATSPDGISWTKNSSFVLDVGGSGTWDSKRAVFARVHRVGSTYHMWYSGDDINVTYTYEIGYASSSDGLVWNKLPDPIFSFGATGSFDSFMVYAADVIQMVDGYSMYYSGGTSLNGPYAIGLARNDAPDASLMEPVEESVYRYGSSVDFTVISHPRPDFGDLTSFWYSDVDGLFAVEDMEPDGSIHFSEAGLSLGTHEITAVIANQGGLVWTDSKLIFVE